MLVVVYYLRPCVIAGAPGDIAGSIERKGGRYGAMVGHDLWWGVTRRGRKVGAFEGMRGDGGCKNPRPLPITGVHLCCTGVCVNNSMHTP